MPNGIFFCLKNIKKQVQMKIQKSLYVGFVDSFRNKTVQVYKK
jgi:hypothetical protein